MLGVNTAAALISLLREQGIEEPSVLEAVACVPRHIFVEPAFAHQAYHNNALPISCGQTISQPYIVAKMTELLNIQSPDMKILEIGTGSGYQTAILAQLVDHLYSIERIKKLQMEAKRRLKALDIYNVSTKHGDGWKGWKSKAPFDAIIVTAAADSIPEQLLEQLNEGGRLIIPVGEDEQWLKCVTKKEGSFIYEDIEAVRFVPLVAGELA